MRIILCAVLAALAMLGASAAQSRMLTIVGHLENAVILPSGLVSCPANSCNNLLVFFAGII